MRGFLLSGALAFLIPEGSPRPHGAERIAWQRLADALEAEACAAWQQKLALLLSFAKLARA